MAGRSLRRRFGDWFGGRGGGARGASPDGPAVDGSDTGVRERIRETIIRLDGQRRLAAEAAARALVTQAEVGRACDEQLAALAAAMATAEAAEVDARRAATQARREADPDLVAFDATATGLAHVHQALGLAAEPLHRLRDEATQNVDRAREVLTRTRATLDEQLRAQVRLLQAWESAEQRRIVRGLRHR